MIKLPFAKLFIPVFMLVVLASCSDDEMEMVGENPNIEECEAMSVLGEILLLEDSKNFIPYPEDISKVIFSDSTGQEYEGIISDYTTEFANASYSGAGSPCPLDPTILISYTWNPEYKSLRIYFEELDLRLSVGVRIISEGNISQGLIADFSNVVLSYPSQVNMPSAQMSVAVNQREHPMPNENYTDFKEELEIHQVKYTNVYILESDSESQEFDLFYSGDHGMVGFKSKEDPALDLKFVRIE